MSTYGPRSGPYPGQPQDPWQDGPATDSYSSGYPDPLTDPGYGLHAQPFPTSGPPGSSMRTGPVGQPVGQVPPPYPVGLPRPPGSVTTEVWGPPRTPASGRSGLVIGAVIAVVLLAIGAAVTAYVLLNRDDGSDDENTQRPPVGSTAADPSSSASSSAGIAAKTGDCLVNRGSTEKPEMQKVSCAKNTYQVLSRVEGTSDKKACEGTAGFTDWYFYNDPDDAKDFVLCLKKRS